MTSTPPLAPRRKHVWLPIAAGFLLLAALFLGLGLRLSAQAAPPGPVPAGLQPAIAPPAPPPPVPQVVAHARSGRSAQPSVSLERGGDPVRPPSHRLAGLDSARAGAGLAFLEAARPAQAPLGVSASPVITFNITTASVTGYTTPNQAVHLVLRNGATAVGEARTRSDGAGYFLADLMQNGRWATVQPGYTLSVDAGGPTTVLTAPNLTGTVTPANDRLAGSITGVALPAAVRVDCWGQSVTVTAASPTGNYTADLGSLVDVSWFHTVNASYQDTNGNWITARFMPQNGLAVYTTYAEVVGSTTPGSAVEVTLQHGGGSATRNTTADIRTGWWAVYFDEIEPGDVVTAKVGGGTVVSTVSALSIGFDLPNDHITGSGPASSPVSVYNYTESGLSWKYTLKQAATNASGSFTAAFPAGTVSAMGWAFVLHHDTASADTLVGADPYLAVADRSGNAVWGYAAPGASLTATLRRGASEVESQQGTADGSEGYYEIYFNEGFRAGDQVTLVGGGLNIMMTLAPLTVRLDLASDAIEGQAPANALLAASTRNINNLGPYWRGYTAASAGGVYRLELAGALDVHNGRLAWVQTPQGNNVDQPAWQQIYTFAPYVELNATHDGLWGYVPDANAPVDLTLRDGGGALKAQANVYAHGLGNFDWTQFRDGGGNVVDIAPGDRVTVESPHSSQEVVAPAISAMIDPATDRVTGVGPANSFVEVRVRDVDPRLRVPTGPDGAFMADFAGLIDLHSGMEAEVATYDAGWNRTLAIAEAPRARTNIMWDNVDGWFGPGVSVQYEVWDHSHQTLKGSGSGTARPDGWLDGIGCNCDIAPGDQVHVTSGAGFEAVLWPIAISGHIDVNADAVGGTMSGGVFPGEGNVWVWSDARGDGWGMDMPIAADGSYVADFGGQFDIWPGDQAEVWYYDANSNLVGTVLRTLRIDVNYGHDWVSLETEPDADFTVTVAGKASYHGQADGDGRFETWRSNNWDPAQPDIQPGDAVVVEAAGYTRSVNPVGTITGAIDLDEDTVSGTIQAPFSGDLRVRCEVWVDNGPDGVETTADAKGGSYSCDFGDVGWDLQVGQDVAVRYFEPDGDGVINVFRSPFARANITWDNVDGWFGPGVTVHYEVRDVTDTQLKGSGDGSTRPDGWMDGVGCGCDIIPGDRVHVTSNAGFDATLRPIPISVQVDANADRVSGQMSVGPFPARGNVGVSSEGRAQGAGMDIDVAADGAYLADFGGRFDILPGDQAEAWYYDAGGNQVGAALQTLRIEVAYDQDWVYARTAPNASIAIQVAGKASLTGQADGGGEVRGWEQAWRDLWVPAQPDIVPGDEVTASSAGWTKSVKPVGMAGAAANAVDDTVAGRIYDSGFSQPLRVRCTVWAENGPPHVDATPQFVSPNGGSFACDLRQIGWDLKPGDTVAVYVLEPDSDAFVHSFEARPGVYLPLALRASP